MFSWGELQNFGIFHPLKSLNITFCHWMKIHRVGDFYAIARGERTILTRRLLQTHIIYGEHGQCFVRSYTPEYFVNVWAKMRKGDKLEIIKIFKMLDLRLLCFAQLLLSRRFYVYSIIVSVVVVGVYVSLGMYVMITLMRYCIKLWKNKSVFHWSQSKVMEWQVGSSTLWFSSKSFLLLLRRWTNRWKKSIDKIPSTSSRTLKRQQHLWCILSVLNLACTTIEKPHFLLEGPEERRICIRISPAPSASLLRSAPSLNSSRSNCAAHITLLKCSTGLCRHTHTEQWLVSTSY